VTSGRIHAVMDLKHDFPDCSPVLLLWIIWTSTFLDRKLKGIDKISTVQLQLLWEDTSTDLKFD